MTNTIKPNPTRWLMEAPVLNVAHLLPSTLAALTATRPGVVYPLNVYALPMLEGVLVFCDDENEAEALPADLRACVAWNLKRGYTWLRFDPSGNVIGELCWYGRIAA